MKNATQRILLTGSLVFGLLNGRPEAFAGQKMVPLPSWEMQNNTLSSSEEKLLSYQQEKEALLRTGHKGSAGHLVKNRIKILDGKIKYLQQQMRLERPRAVAAVTRKVSPTKAVSPAPVLKLKPFAAMEPRRRIFLARVPVTVQSQPMALAEQRDDAAQGIIPPVPVKQAAPIAKQEPQKQIASIASASVEKRAEASEDVIPLKVSFNSYEKPSSRISPEMLAVSVKPSALAAVGERSEAAQGPLSAAKDVPRKKGVKTGADWKIMTRPDKEIYVLSVMGNLSRRDIFLERSYNFYIDELDRMFKNDPALENEYVHHLLMKSAFENEPESRKDIEKVWQ